jgi:hypothetical protein
MGCGPMGRDMAWEMPRACRAGACALSRTTRACGRRPQNVKTIFRALARLRLTPLRVLIVSSACVS